MSSFLEQVGHAPPARKKKMSRPPGTHANEVHMQDLLTRSPWLTKVAWGRAASPVRDYLYPYSTRCLAHTHWRR